MNATLQVVAAVAETIEVLGSVPDGHLYSRLCDRLTLASYTAIIDTLAKAGLVSRKNHLLTWTGPTRES